MNISRRHILRGIGVGTISALAGCTGGSSGDNTEDEPKNESNTTATTTSGVQCTENGGFRPDVSPQAILESADDRYAQDSRVSVSSEPNGDPEVGGSKTFVAPNGYEYTVVAGRYSSAEAVEEASGLGLQVRDGPVLIEVVFTGLEESKDKHLRDIYTSMTCVTEEHITGGLDITVSD